MGLRRGGPLRHEERVAARSRARHRHRPAGGQAGDGAQALPGRGARLHEGDTVAEALKELTGGQGPDSCIDAVGMEAHGTTLAAWYDPMKQIYLP